MNPAALRLTRDEDETFLADEAARWVKANASVDRVRALRDRGDATGWSRELWGTLCELGWSALTTAEDAGGAGLGVFGGALLLEEAGRRLMPEPLLPTFAALEILARCPAGAVRDAIVRDALEGDRVVGLGLEEPGGRGDAERVRCVAEGSSTGWLLDGAKAQALEGHVADVLLVTARTGDAVGLFAVPWDTPGLRRERQTRIDGRGAALIHLDGAEVERSACLCADVADILQPALDRARILLAAEALGGAAQAFADTLDYIKGREQFGVAIGSFQALQHRAARVFMRVEMARSAVLAAARTADAPDAAPVDVARMASLAKTVAGDAYRLAAEEGIQMHGGVGVTDEYDIGFHLKRALCIEATWGDAAWHRRRWAALAGY